MSSRPLTRLATTAAVALLAVLALPILEPPPAPGPAAPDPGGRLPDAGTETSPSKPATLRISNEHGPVTVTSAAGSKVIFLPLLPGDDS